MIDSPVCNSTPSVFVSTSFVVVVVIIIISLLL